MSAADQMTSPTTPSATGTWRLDPARSLELTATVREIDGELEIDASTNADHRELGMTWSPLGILRAPSTLIVRGRLVRP
jgi:hypothetical protein